jgi:hypothetical protein
LGHRADCIHSYTGRLFWPLDPSPADVDTHDIAHALSKWADQKLLATEARDLMNGAWYPEIWGKWGSR